jgi:putative two-component system response regulator
MVDSRKQKILVADELGDNRALLAEILGEYTVIQAEDGERAIGILQEHWAEFALVILEAAMPKLDGFTVLETMKQEGWLKSVPVIMISCTDSESQLAQAFSMGATDLLVRPLEPLALRQRVHNTIQLSLSQRKLRELEAARGGEQLRQERRQEQMKLDSYAAMNREIQFEYTAEPESLTISNWGAKLVGMAPVIVHPKQDKMLAMLLGGEEELRRIVGIMQGLTPEHPSAQYECPLHYGGESRWFKLFFQGIWSQTQRRLVGVLGKAVDIDEPRSMLKNLEKRISQDSLTGLLNHVSAQELIWERIHLRPKDNFTLVLIDLDHFKQANDTYGHIFGDRVIRYIADQLRQNTRSSDIVARMGGDEFLVFLEIGSNVEPVISRLFRALGGQYENFQLSFSMGVAQTSMVGNDYQTLFHAADQALYCVKGSGKGGYRFYDRSMQNILLETAADN